VKGIKKKLSKSHSFLCAPATHSSEIYGFVTFL
jgi:pectin methylesterase-like acyl-CoA thioesterase